MIERACDAGPGERPDLRGPELRRPVRGRAELTPEEHGDEGGGTREDDEESDSSEAQKPIICVGCLNGP